MYHVSEENMLKVEAFFVQKVREVGTNQFEATVVEIAEGSGVALATAHRAIKELKKQNVIDIIKPTSRRFAITYIYKRDIQDFNVEQSKEGRIEYLTGLVQTQNDEIEKLRNEINKITGERNVIAQKLREYQDNDKNFKKDDNDSDDDEI
ncbi:MULTISPECIES: hypothetical protein [Paenibacillus]|uniref:hypothetical protein n=1 Tax=Paenibacillus TaxID=44249 RepID=UPI000F5346C6|nr:hypothetical protein [Paenibacillus xylanexedens]RPK20001.1 hypothetical protein EDO6_06518 [Paenibacillus xylanexedens]